MKKGERRKEEILQTASDLFAQKGYLRTTLNDIISQIGCSKGSFYHHFESKLQVLQALASQRTLNAYQAYAGDIPDDPLERLNRLLYYTCPFRAGEEQFLSSLLGLDLQQEGAVITQHVRASLKSGFYADVLATLEKLRDQGTAFYTNAALPELLWEAHMAFLTVLTQEGCRLVVSGGTPASRVIEMLHAIRFLWERMLDIPYGTMDILPAEELLQTLTAAVSAVEGVQQLRFDTGYAAPCQQLPGTV